MESQETSTIKRMAAKHGPARVWSVVAAGVSDEAVIDGLLTDNEDDASLLGAVKEWATSQFPVPGELTN